MKIAYTTLGAALFLAVTAQAADAPAPPMTETMTCSVYIAAEKSAGTYGVPSGDKDTDALEKKIVDYCLANPKALATAAVEKAMGG